MLLSGLCYLILVHFHQNLSGLWMVVLAICDIHIYSSCQWILLTSFFLFSSSDYEM